MKAKEWLNKVAYLKFVPMEGMDDEDVPKSWLSNYDDSYITFEGLEEGMSISVLADREITEELTHGVGYSPKDKKWYGWSHRAIYGFTISSTCNKGDCHYNPVDKGDFLDDMIRFWSDEDHLGVTGTHGQQEILEYEPCEVGGAELKPVHTGKYEDGVHITWTYSDTVPNRRLRNEITSVFQRYPDKYGRGEWTAETIEDAKQMATDFSKGVS